MINTITTEQVNELLSIITTAETKASKLLGVPVNMQIISTSIFLAKGNKNLEQVMLLLAGHYSLDVADIISNSRYRKIVEARQMFWHVAKQLFNTSVTHLGKLTGRDHATVIYGINTIKGLIQVDSDVRERYNELYLKLKIFNNN